MSNYTSGQKVFLWGTLAVLGALIGLPATYGVYSVCERVGGLLPSLGYSLAVFTGFMGLQIFMHGMSSGWETEKDGRKLSFFDSLAGSLAHSALMLGILIGASWALIIVSYGWLLAGVAPFSR